MKKTNQVKNIAKTVEEWATPIAQPLGLTIWDTEFKKEGADWVLRVYIDAGERSISTEDCEQVSRALEVILDREDPIEQAYMLEVSSPGLERVLSRPEHFARYIGSDINVKLFGEVDGLKAFVGKLVSFEDGIVTAEVQGKTISFEQKRAAAIRLNVVF